MLAFNIEIAYFFKVTYALIKLCPHIHVAAKNVVS